LSTPATAAGLTQDPSGSTEKENLTAFEGYWVSSAGKIDNGVATLYDDPADNAAIEFIGVNGGGFAGTLMARPGRAASCSQPAFALRKNETPIAVMSDAMRGEFRRGRYATRSLMKPNRPQAIIDSSRTSTATRPG